MSTYQLLSCDVALGGDILNVVARHALIPVTYPELLVLKYLHGDTAVSNVFDVGCVEREDGAEFGRLVETYGAVHMKALFPGAGVRLPNGDNHYAPRVVGTIINPGPVAAPPIPDLPLLDATDLTRLAGDPAAPTPASYSAPNTETGYVPVPEAPAAAPVPAPSPPADEAPRIRRPTPVSDIPA